MNTKLTGKTIKDAVFTFVTWSSNDGDANEQSKLDKLKNNMRSILLKYY